MSFDLFLFQIFLWHQSNKESWWHIKRRNHRILTKSLFSEISPIIGICSLAWNWFGLRLWTKTRGKQTPLHCNSTGKAHLQSPLQDFWLGSQWPACLPQFIVFVHCYRSDNHQQTTQLNQDRKTDKSAPGARPSTNRPAPWGRTVKNGG